MHLVASLQIFPPCPLWSCKISHFIVHSLIKFDSWNRIGVTHITPSSPQIGINFQNMADDNSCITSVSEQNSEHFKVQHKKLPHGSGQIIMSLLWWMMNKLNVPPQKINLKMHHSSVKGIFVNHYHWKLQTMLKDITNPLLSQ